MDTLNRMVNRTRKQRGGFTESARRELTEFVLEQTPDTKKQIQHCITQLRRFTGCVPFRTLQFGYNLGRLQELCKSIGSYRSWWPPMERAIEAGRWDVLARRIDSLRATLGVDYDMEILHKCD